MGRREEHSLRSKAAHFVSDLTTVLLNPISDKPSKPTSPRAEDVADPERSQLESITEEGSKELVDGPDTSSFSAFLYSLLSSAESGSNSDLDEQNEYKSEMGESTVDPIMKGGKKKSLFSRGKQSLGKAIYKAAKLSGYQNQTSEGKGSSDITNNDGYDSEDAINEGIAMQTLNEPVASENLDNLPETSEPSLLLSEKTRSALYVSLPALVHGRKWVLLYSTWRHGISLSTLYRRSMLCPGISLLLSRYLGLTRKVQRSHSNGSGSGRRRRRRQRQRQWKKKKKKMKKKKRTSEEDAEEEEEGTEIQDHQVVGDRKGAVFGGLVEAPLRPTNKKYQGTNSTFVFTNTPGYPVIFRPTGVNRYFTLCSPDFLALGGGHHAALYLDADLLSGSSSASETYGNSCLASTEDFEVKEIELWGFVYASKYEEMISLLRTEAPGICRW